MKTGMLTLGFTHTGGVKSDGRREIMAQSSVRCVCGDTQRYQSSTTFVSHQSHNSLQENKITCGLCGLGGYKGSTER